MESEEEAHAVSGQWVVDEWHDAKGIKLDRRIDCKDVFSLGQVWRKAY